MNLKTYNAQNAPHKVAPKSSRRLSISFNDKGRFLICRTLYETMGKPSGVVILQDSQYPSDFYIRPSRDPIAFQLKNGSRNQFYFKSNTLAGIMAEAIHVPPPPIYIEIQCVRERRRTVLHRHQEAYRQVA